MFGANALPQIEFHKTYASIFYPFSNFGLFACSHKKKKKDWYVWKCVIYLKKKKEEIRASSWGNTIALVIWLMKINLFHVLGYTATAYYLWKVLGASISKCIVTAEVTLNGQADLVAVCLHLTKYLQMPRKKWNKVREGEREREKSYSLCPARGEKRS